MKILVKDVKVLFFKICFSIVWCFFFNMTDDHPMSLRCVLSFGGLPHFHAPVIIWLAFEWVG